MSLQDRLQDEVFAEYGGSALTTSSKLRVIDPFRGRYSQWIGTGQELDLQAVVFGSGMTLAAQIRYFDPMGLADGRPNCPHGGFQIIVLQFMNF
jgi:hypothetical protein